MYWLWAILLLIAGMGLAVMEVFFPSAGILAFLSASAIVAAVVLGFMQSSGAGIGILLVALFGVPSVIVLGFRLWPRTAMGRRVMLMAPGSEEVLPDDPQRRQLKSLLGKTGRAKCKMLPGGSVQVDGRIWDAVSEGSPIEAGEAVRVVQVRGGRLVVRRLEEENPSETAADPMQRPIETVIPDPFEDRPA